MVMTTEASPTATTGPGLTPKRYSVGVDLGQANDPTAVAVLEKTVVPPETAMFSPVGDEPGNRLVEGDLVYDLIYLKRAKLGTAYDEIARRVAGMVIGLEPKGAFDEIGQLTLSVDGTGVGRAVCDMIFTELTKRKQRGEYVPEVDYRRVSVTGGNSSVQKPSSANRYWRVPKQELIFPLVASFQQRKVRIAKSVKDKETLKTELLNYRRNTNIATGNMTFEPWREGDHDDLLFAVALALWGWRQPKGQTRVRLIR
jgi:hypothetical protein